MPSMCINVSVCNIFCHDLFSPLSIQCNGLKWKSALIPFPPVTDWCDTSVHQKRVTSSHDDMMRMKKYQRHFHPALFQLNDCIGDRFAWLLGKDGNDMLLWKIAHSVESGWWEGERENFHRWTTKHSHYVRYSRYEEEEMTYSATHAWPNKSGSIEESRERIHSTFLSSRSESDICYFGAPEWW